MSCHIEFVPCSSELPTAWKMAFADAAATSFDLDADWFRLLSNTALNPGEDAYWCLASEGEHRAGIPMVIRPERAGALTNFYATYFRPMLSGPAAAALLPPLLFSLRKRWPAVGAWWFAPTSLEDPYAAPLFNALKSSGLSPFQFFAFGNWYHPCATEDWETYLASRSGNLRSNIKRRLKKFEQMGGELRVAQTGEELPAALADYEAVYAASWKHAEPYPQFIPGLVEMAARKGWLRLGIARLNGQAIAAQLWFVYEGKAFMYKMGYDEQFKDHSPGLVLTAHITRHVLDEDHVQVIDFLIGDDDYKQNWMTQRRERVGFVAYNPRTLAGAIGLAKEVSARLIRRIKPAAKSPSV